MDQGESQARWLEVADQMPYLTINAATVTANMPFSGVCLVPKLSLTVMDAEIARLLCISGNHIVPISFTVPRKSYRDFHEDLFPDTCGGVPAMTSSEWLQGKTATVHRVSVNPARGHVKTKQPLSGSVESDSMQPHTAAIDTTKTVTVQLEQTVIGKNGTISSSYAIAEKTPTVQNEQTPVSERKPEPNTLKKSPEPETDKHKALAGFRSSAFRYMSGKPMHPKENFEDLRGLNCALSSESNSLDCNELFLAFPLNGPGGRIAVRRVDKPGRFAPVIPSCISGSEVGDFALSSVSKDLLLTGCEDGKVRIWRVPENGYEADSTEPAAVLCGHLNRVNLVQLHPFVANLANTASMEQSSLGGQSPLIRLWDVGTQQQVQQLDGFTDTVFGSAWHRDGKNLLLTSCKDKQLRIFDPRSANVVHSILGHEGVRACRVVWTGDQHFVSVGYGR
jgi:coronin-7